MVVSVLAPILRGLATEEDIGWRLLHDGALIMVQSFRAMECSSLSLNFLLFKWRPVLLDAVLA